MKSFLVVDDSRLLRKVAGNMLATFHFEIFEAENGLDALDHCRARMPDGVLLDWNMPVMDGMAFLRALRDLPGGDRPKVIFCTTEAVMARITEALTAGADEYIMKPFDESVLASKLAIVGLIAMEAVAA